MKQLKELKDIRKIHFVGIGGAGMSPLAKIMVELGYEVSGSDRTDSDVIGNLRKMGAKITLGGQKAENVKGVDAIVVSTAIPYDNPEVLAARDLGIMKLHRSDINAASAAVPDRTWFYYNMEHEQAAENTALLELVAAIASSDEPIDVFTLPDHPQFVDYC